MELTVFVTRHGPVGSYLFLEDPAADIRCLKRGCALKTHDAGTDTYVVAPE